MEHEKDALALAQVVLRQGELRLQAQMAVTLAANQRAITLAGILVAATTAAVGVGVAQMGQPLGHGALAAAAMFITGAACCIRAAWPVRFRLVGNLPDNWWDDEVMSRPLADCLKKESDNYSGRIRENVRTINACANWLMAGVIAAALAPVAGLMVAVCPGLG